MILGHPYQQNFKIKYSTFLEHTFTFVLLIEKYVSSKLMLIVAEMILKKVL